MVEDARGLTYSLNNILVEYLVEYVHCAFFILMVFLFLVL